MAENALRRPMMVGTYLEVISCLGAALVVLLGGDMDLKIVDGFVMVLETGLTLVLVNVKGLGGEALREPMDSNRSFPVMSTISNTILNEFIYSLEQLPIVQRQSSQNKVRRQLQTLKDTFSI